MAKELPYFKFEPSEWQNGDIQMCSHEAKSIFIDICCSYWQRLGDLPYAFALQRHCGGNETALQELIKHDVLENNDGELSINFLNEQIEELTEKSEKARKSAEARWNKSKNANASETHSDRNANRIEENRKEKNKKEEINNIKSETKVSDKSDSKQNEVSVFNSQKEKKLPKVAEKGFNEDVYKTLEICLKFFPKHLHPNSKQEESWLDTIDKLNRLDNIPFELIVGIVRMVREDDFWSKNFLSMNKLRQKNKDGIMYIVVFAEKFKPQQIKKADRRLDVVGANSDWNI